MAAEFIRVVKAEYDFEKKEIAVTILCDLCRKRTRASNTFPPTPEGPGATQIHCAECDKAVAARLPHPSEFRMESGRS